MKLQKATRCAIFAVLELAKVEGRSLSAAEIGGRYGLSTHHLAKVLPVLGKAGLVTGSRGAGGGYTMVRQAGRTTLLDVIELFEPIGGRAPLEEGDETAEGRALRRVLKEIDETARTTFASITIETALTLARRRR